MYHVDTAEVTTKIQTYIYEDCIWFSLQDMSTFCNSQKKVVSAIVHI